MRSPRKVLYDPSHVILRGMAWFFVGVAASMGTAWLAAWIVPAPPQTKSVGTGVMAARFTPQPESSVILDWYAMLGGERPVYAEHSGWPIRCWSVWYKQHPGGAWELIAGVPLGRSRPSSVTVMPLPWALPLVPRLWQAAASASMYGVLGWAGWSAIILARARRRRTRGLCAACGYGPWEANGPCPECGRSEHAHRRHQHARP